MNMRPSILACSTLLFFIVACSSVPAAPSSPTALPSATGALPSATVVPPTEVPPTATPSQPVVRFLDLSMIDAQAGWVWAVDPYGTLLLLRTTDGGLRWEVVTPADPTRSYEGSVILDVQTAWAWLSVPATYSYTLLRTTDGGETWTTQADSLSFEPTNVTFSSATDGWAYISDVGAGQAHIQLYETHDGGATWTRLMLGFPSVGLAPVYEGTLHLCNICGDTFYYDPHRLLVVGGNYAMDPASDFPLHLSLDGGQTWQTQRLSLPAGPFERSWIGPFQPAFFGETDGWLPVELVTEDYLRHAIAFYRTSDGGQSWTFQSLFVTSGRPGAPQFVSLQDAFVRCGLDLCASHDGMLTWQTLATDLDFNSPETGPYVMQYQFVDALTGWALVGRYGEEITLWRSLDGGATWTALSPVILP